MKHIQCIRNKFAQAQGAIRRIQPLLDKKALLNVYYCSAYSFLQCSISTWGNANNTDLKSIYKIINLLHKNKDKNHSNINHEAQVKLLSTEQIFKLEIGKFIHKLYNNQLPKNFKKYVIEIKQIRSYSTRSSCNKNYFLPR